MHKPGYDMVKTNLLLPLLYTFFIVAGVLRPELSWANELACESYFSEIKPRQIETRHDEQIPKDAYSSYLEFSEATNDQRTSYHTHELPVVQLRDINNKQELGETLGYAGAQQRKLIQGRLEGREVFVKLVSEIRFRGSAGLSEASYAKLMGDLGLGPKFHGVIVEKGKVIGIVTDFVKGQGIYHGDPTDLTPQSREKSAKVSSFLSSIGVQPIDLQYRITPTGRLWIIDTGEFEYHDRNTYRTEKEFTDALKETHKKMEGNSLIN